MYTHLHIDICVYIYTHILFLSHSTSHTLLMFLQEDLETLFFNLANSDLSPYPRLCLFPRLWLNDMDPSPDDLA